MNHSEFASRSLDPNFLWGIHNLALARNSGPLGKLAIFVITLLCLSPAATYFSIAAHAGHWVQFLWAPLVLLAVVAGRPNLNLIEALPWYAVAATSWFTAKGFSWAIAAGGPACLLTWYASGLIRGGAMAALRWRLVKSARLFEYLKASGCLWLPEDTQRRI